jgi:hypothetical protein
MSWEWQDIHNKSWRKSALGLGREEVQRVYSSGLVEYHNWI